ncbi:MAG: hypothetical protein HWN80_07690 [Candidatus Lokiarchaeota archaeon]|nr:hypothetical protein [Candidatus Lokiarchaeota archaeon]
MKKLNIKNKEIRLLVLVGVLTFLFISVNSNQFLSFLDNNTNQESQNFQNDFPRASAPIVNVILPANNTVVGARPLIQVTAIDVNLDLIWYRIASNIIFINNDSAELLNLLIWNALPEGPFTIELFANDTAGNLNNFHTLNLTKDTSAPIVDIVHPLPDETYSTSAPQITLNINDATLDSAWYYIAGTNFTFQFTPSLGTNIITINQEAWNSLSEGNVTIIFYANDSLGRISFDSIRLEKDLPEVFDFIAFLLSPPGLTIIGIVIAIVIVVILLRRRSYHRTSEKEVRKIESLWD